jgi:hypothetical protein
VGTKYITGKKLIAGNEKEKCSQCTGLFVFSLPGSFVGANNQCQNQKEDYEKK